MFLKHANVSGTARTDFNELIDGDDQLDFDKFTVIAVDPPGLGKSRPPQRKYGKDVYDIDCQCYHAVMQVSLHLQLAKIVNTVRIVFHRIRESAVIVSSVGMRARKWHSLWPSDTVPKSKH